MLMKFAGACFAVMLLVACSANNAATVTTSGFDCRNPNEYRFVEVENPESKKGLRACYSQRCADCKVCND